MNNFKVCYFCGCKVNLTRPQMAYSCDVDVVEDLTIHKLVCPDCCADYDYDKEKIKEAIKTLYLSDEMNYVSGFCNHHFSPDLAIEIQKLIVRRTRPIPEAGDHPAIPYIPHDLGLDILELLKERLGKK